MRQSISHLAFLETVRSRRFWIALAAGAGLCLMPTLVPVRFKDPIEFSIECSGATLLLWGLFFSALCVLPSLSRGRFSLRARSVGAWPRKNLLVTLEQGWGQLVAFLAGSSALLSLQWLALWLSPIWRGGRDAGFAQFLEMTSAGVGGVLQGIAVVALARLIAPLFAPAAAQLTFLALVVSTHFLALQLHQGPGGSPPEWWGVAIGLLLPAVDLIQGANSGSALLWASVAVATYWISSNIVLTWILEHSGDTLVRLDDHQGGA